MTRESTEETVTQSDQEAYEEFVRRYGRATTDYEFARILSGRLRDLDKRTKAANRRADDCASLLHAASLFIEEAEKMGWGKTSETALPGSWDNLVAAVREAQK